MTGGIHIVSGCRFLTVYSPLDREPPHARHTSSKLGFALTYMTVFLLAGCLRVFRVRNEELGIRGVSTIFLRRGAMALMAFLAFSIFFQH